MKESMEKTLTQCLCTILGIPMIGFFAGPVLSWPILGVLAFCILLPTLYLYHTTGKDSGNVSQ